MRPPNRHVDQHLAVVLDSASNTAELMAGLRKADDPQAAVEERIDSAANQFVDALVGYDPLGTLEAIRMTTLPFAPAGVIPAAGAQSGPAVSELLATAVLCTLAESESGRVLKRVDQDLCAVIGERLIPLAHEILNLATARDLIAADRSDEMAQIAAVVRGNGRWMRGTSYPDMQEETLRGLFGAPAVDGALHAVLGFGVVHALSFLNACHQMQMDQFNTRGQDLADAFSHIDMSTEHVPTEGERRITLEGLTGFFNPSPRQAAIPVADVAFRAGLPEEVASKVATFFAAPVPSDGAGAALRAYLDGNSPLRARPLVVRDDLVMTVHPALIPDSVKAALEDALKDSAHWETYAAHRGKYLEGRIADIFSKLVPGVVDHHSIEYFVPATEYEAAGDPDGFTKLVEADHLFVLHDVAFIVEDKAIPLSDRSRTGEVNPLRRNLASAITKGAEQAGRLKQRIAEDRSLRLRDGTRLDLADVREIHSIVTSLDDMPGIATATSKLVGAGLLPPDNIPWTVSLNDLDLISQLIDRPAEFLLYIRRRTEPKATEMFMAVDELDLFLLFFRMGLYVEPDPDVAFSEMPWLDTPRTADLRRFRDQVPSLVTSHTDALDAWYYSRRRPAGEDGDDAHPKPRMVSSPLAPLIDWLDANKIFGWLSIGATLLEGSSDAQEQLAARAVELTSHPAATGKPRSIAIPWGLTKRDGWLLVWMTRPTAMDGEAVVQRAHAYMVAKKHQLGYRRGASFVYDEPTGSIIGASYDSGQTEVDRELLAQLVASLRPLGDMDTQAQMTQRRRAAERRRERR
ncbi:hypothetical protein GCM10008944_20540 [Cytobacillus oceanisediminis]